MKQPLVCLPFSLTRINLDSRKLTGENLCKNGFSDSHLQFYPGFLTSLHSSTKTKKRSKRDMMGADSWMFCFSGLVLSYRPPTGLAAAKMDVRAFSVACKNTREEFQLFNITLKIGVM